MFLTSFILFRYNRIHLTKELKKQNQDPKIISDLHQQQQELDAVIAGMVQQRKNLEAEQSLKRKSSATARSQLKTIREAKRKQDIPVFADIENILLEYGISAAAYHGGKLNGVDLY